MLGDATLFFGGDPLLLREAPLFFGGDPLLLRESALLFGDDALILGGGALFLGSLCLDGREPRCPDCHHKQHSRARQEGT